VAQAVGATSLGAGAPGSADTVVGLALGSQIRPLQVQVQGCMQSMLESK